jgi:acyl-CoA reductase-like NAD-dependent aldehyde dehydrogenase
MLIDGRWAEAQSGRRFGRESPAHDVPVGDYPLADEADTDRAVAAARRAFDEGPWPHAPGAERARLLNRVAEKIRAAAEELAYVEVLESGKLSAGVWTRDIDTAFRVSRGVRAGTIWVYTFMDGYPELSFGGYKESGLGRELGRFAIDEFTELKTVQLRLGPHTNRWHRPERDSALT